MPTDREKSFHEPVMPDEVCGFLSPCLSSGTVVDATVGGGGHTRHLIEHSAARASGTTRILGVDIDHEALTHAHRILQGSACRVVLADSNEDAASEAMVCRVASSVILVHSSYVDMESVVDRLGLRPVTGVLFDFGVSLHQLTTPGRGFGHDVVGDADMRFDPRSSCPPAWELLQRATESEVADWLRRYGDEPNSRRIARRLCRERGRIRTTEDIVRVVAASVPVSRLRRSLARVFLALRIAVNRELDTVRKGLAVALRLLEQRGRLVAISYHSGEDSLVKSALRDGARAGRLQLLTRKPMRPAFAEVQRNPRARSARLRAAEVRA